MSILIIIIHTIGSAAFNTFTVISLVVKFIIILSYFRLNLSVLNFLLNFVSHFAIMPSVLAFSAPWLCKDIEMDV